MYDKLVWRLRYMPIDMRCAKVMKEAADAIEKLSELADAIPHICECCVGCELENENWSCNNGFILSPKRAMQYLIKPSWISVTEQLPEESEGLYWHDDTTIRFVSVWCCDYTTGIIGIRNRFQGKMTGNYYLDQYTKDTEWHWSVASWEPTHWMPIVPLPKEPKEE